MAADQLSCEHAMFSWPRRSLAPATPDEVIRMHKEQIQDMMEFLREVCQSSADFLCVAGQS